MTGSHNIDSEIPIEMFDSWLKQAQESEPNDPNATALATSTPDGVPSVRMVLAKQVGGRPFCFFTNAESRKGLELANNPRAALCFHWKSLRRQVRVEGKVSALEASDVDEYFHSRSRASQIGEAVSHQSRILKTREELEARVREFGEQHPGEIPRPGFWCGFHLQAERIEFCWMAKNRLHDRFLFTKEETRWQKARLYP